MEAEVGGGASYPLPGVIFFQLGCRTAVVTVLVTNTNHIPSLHEEPICISVACNRRHWLYSAPCPLHEGSCVRCRQACDSEFVASCWRSAQLVQNFKCGRQFTGHSGTSSGQKQILVGDLKNWEAATVNVETFQRYPHHLTVLDKALNLRP